MDSGSSGGGSRAIAIEVCSRYFGEVEESSSHADNVFMRLRPHVREMTRNVLSRRAVESCAESNGSVFGNGFGNSEEKVRQRRDWKDFLNESYSAAEPDKTKSPGTGAGTGTGESRDKVLSARALARMDAFLSGLSLAVPRDPIGSESTIEIRNGQRGRKNGRRRRRFRYLQITQEDLLRRLDLYFSSLIRLVDLREEQRLDKQIASDEDPHIECALLVDSHKMLRQRINTVSASFVATASCVTAIQPILTALIDSMTREVLAVEALGENLQAAITRIVAEYEMQTSFASIAFLSSPQQSGESVLAPLLSSFLKYLRYNLKTLVFECQLERMLALSIDTQLRHTFKTMEWTSIGHIIDTCHANRYLLEHMELSPLAFKENLDADTAALSGDDPMAVKQALRDLRRETITVNGNVMPPANSLRQLVNNLTDALNSKTTASGEEDLFVDLLDSDSTSAQAFLLPDGESDGQSSESEATDPDEEDADYTATRQLCLHGDAHHTSVVNGNGNANANGSANANANAARSEFRKRTRRRRRHFDIRTIDKMTLRLMLASCRTGTGGDAYFVVQDLFGGEDVMVVASTPSSGEAGTAPAGSDSTRKKGPKGTIEIIVRLTSVVIKVHGSYNVYPKVMPDDDCEPLIQLHTTTTETISLQQVRIPDAHVQNGDAGYCEADSTSYGDGTLENGVSTLVLKEKITGETGKRILSVWPARYEKVQVWSTPS